MLLGRKTATNKQTNIRAPKENVNHVNEVLPHYTTHLIQRPCYQPGSQSQALADKTIGPYIDPVPHTIVKETQNNTGMATFLVQQIWSKSSCKVKINDPTGLQKEEGMEVIHASKEHPPPL